MKWIFFTAICVLGMNITETIDSFRERRYTKGKIKECTASGHAQTQFVIYVSILALKLNSAK